MQQIDNSQKSSEGRDRHGNESSRLSKRDVVGGAVLLIFVAGALSGYYAYNYINKDSARMQFWVGFMFSFAALVVVAIQVAIYWQQAEFMAQQLEATAIAERAYLGFKGMSWSADPETPRDRIQIHAMLVNGGHTPARDIERRLRVALIEPPPDPFSWSDPITQPSDSEMSFMPEGAEMQITPPTILNITEQMWEEFADGKRHIYFDGQILFTDYAGKRQVFGFGWICRYANSEQFQERYQYQRDADPN